MRAAGSSRRTNTICARGTMMSRTCRSATSSTPSSMVQRIGVDHAALGRLAQHRDQLLAVLRLGLSLGEAPQPAPGGVQILLLGHRYGTLR